MARSAIFYLLFLATHASLVLLYPFTLSRFLLTLSIYGLGTLIMLYLLFHPRNQWLVPNRSRVEGVDCVALTFDDGPDPVDTPKLLDLLREKGVKATFFVVGKRADQYPEITILCFVSSRPGVCEPRSNAVPRAFAAVVVSVRASSVPRWASVTRCWGPISRMRGSSMFPGLFGRSTGGLRIPTS
jgi:hypothetical protein